MELSQWLEPRHNCRHNGRHTGDPRRFQAYATQRSRPEEELRDFFARETQRVAMAQGWRAVADVDGVGWWMLMGLMDA